MNLEDVKALKELLSTPQHIVIVPHKNPDGDAIGSTLALYLYLKELGLETVVISPNDYPKFLKWMPGNETIINFEWDMTTARTLIQEATLIFTLDFNHLSRIDKMQPYLEGASAKFVMIDHHQAPSDYAEITFSDTSKGSTCEMVYDLIETLGDLDKISVDIANCLYTGIMTDTGSFKFPSTTSRTHRVVADLIDKGAKNSEINNKVYDTNTPDRLHLLGCALKNMVILEEYRTAYITLSQEELDAYNYKKGDTEGFVNYGLTLQNICLALIFIENREESIIKISLRSQGSFSVNDFARKHFEGGGHTNAAGGKSNLTLKETANHFESLLEDYKEELIACRG